MKFSARMPSTVPRPKHHASKRHRPPLGSRILGRESHGEGTRAAPIEPHAPYIVMTTQFRHSRPFAPGGRRGFHPSIHDLSPDWLAHPFSPKTGPVGDRAPVIFFVLDWSTRRLFFRMPICISKLTLPVLPGRTRRRGCGPPLGRKTLEAPNTTNIRLIWQGLPSS
jgi:hypothetical protein